MIFLLVFYIVCVVIFGIASIFGIFMMVKNNNTADKRDHIINAIYIYNLKHYNNKISYDYMEDYETTLYRLWDWGYKNIVPKSALKPAPNPLCVRFPPN